MRGSLCRNLPAMRVDPSSSERFGDLDQRLTNRHGQDGKPGFWSKA